MSKKLLSASLCCLSLNAFAEDAITDSVEESPFAISAELGALFKTGDTKSTDMKAGLDIDYKKDVWKSLLRFDVLVKKSESEDENGNDNFDTTDQKWTIVSQTNYTLDKNRSNYVYGNVWYEDDRFNSFENQSSVSMGWGKRWYETEVASLDADIGPGYKRDVIAATETMAEETEGSFIVQGQALYTRKINEHVEFKQLLVAKYVPDSDENSTYKGVSSLTTKLIESLQMKISFTVDHNTKVDEDKENTNTQTSLTFIYSF